MADNSNTVNSNTAAGGNKPPQPVSVINTDPIIQFLDRKAAVSAEELKTLVTRGVAGQVLVGGDVTFTDGSGKTFSRPKTINDVNGHLVYVKLEVDSLKNNPTFMTGWFPAKRTNDGGQNIPDHYFDANGYVFFGEALLAWTTREHYNERFVKPHRERLEATLGRVSGGLGSTGVDQDFSVTKG